MLINYLCNLKSNGYSNGDSLSFSIQNTHPYSGHSVSQRGHGVALAGAHNSAVRTNHLLLRTTEPVELCLMLHTQITFTGEDPGLGIGGGRSRLRHLLPPLHVAAQRG